MRAARNGNPVKPPGTHSRWRHPLTREIDRQLATGTPLALDDLLRSFQAIAIDRALAFTGGNRSQAARLLGIGRNTIARKIAELELNHRQPAQSNDASA